MHKDENWIHSKVNSMTLLPDSSIATGWAFIPLTDLSQFNNNFSSES